MKKLMSLFSQFPEAILSAQIGQGSPEVGRKVRVPA